MLALNLWMLNNSDPFMGLIAKILVSSRRTMSSNPSSFTSINKLLLNLYFGLNVSVDCRVQSLLKILISLSLMSTFEIPLVSLK